MRPHPSTTGIAPKDVPEIPGFRLSTLDSPLSTASCEQLPDGLGAEVDQRKRPTLRTRQVGLEIQSQASVDRPDNFRRRDRTLGRIGGAEDIAGVAVMLASRAGAYVTGAIIPVDGGVLTL